MITRKYLFLKKEYNIFMKTNFKEVELIKDLFNDDSEDFSNLLFLLKRFETSIHNREGHYIKLDIRYLMDWFFESDVVKKIFIKEKIIKKVASKKYVFIDEKDIDLRKKSHNLVHYNDENQIKVRDGAIERTIPLKDKDSVSGMITYARFFHKLLKIILKNSDSSVEWNFDEDVYANGKSSFDVLNRRNKLLDKEGDICKLCEIGKISMPEDETFPHGPYLQCTNKECKAILSTNLNLKLKIKERCRACSNKKDYSKKRWTRKTYSYNTDEKFFECLNCGFKWIEEKNG